MILSDIIYTLLQIGIKPINFTSSISQHSKYPRIIEKSKKSSFVRIYNFLFLNNTLQINNKKMFNKRLSFFEHNFSFSKKQSRKQLQRSSIPSSIKFQISSLMKENYLVDIEKLQEDEYFVCIKPRGTNCIVITQNNATFIYSDSYKLLYETNTSLPNHEIDEPNTILEGYFITNQLVYIQDVIMWNCQDFTSKTAKQRFSFIKANLLTKSSGFTLLQVEFYVCDLDSCP